MKRLQIAYVVALLLACGGRYDIVVIDAGDAIDDGTEWELAIVRGGCPDGVGSGAPADDDGTERVLRWSRGEQPPSIGSVPSGRYGFYVRVLRGECGVGWTGCAEVSAAAGGSGDLQIALAEIDVPVCDDGRFCTANSCDEASICVNTTVDCDDGNVCTVDSCDEEEQGCIHPRLDPSVDCDDGDACTADECDDEEGCVHPSVECDDGDACTADTCDSVRGCLHTPVDGDGDGVPCADDCDDDDPEVAPEAHEICNEVDDDCDGVVDDDFATCRGVDDECVGDFGPWEGFVSCARRVTWAEAIAVCDRNGGALVQSAIQETPNYAELPGSWWIGVTRDSEDRWVDLGGDPVVVGRWETEPDAGDPACVAIRKPSADWFDEPCGALHASLCWVGPPG